LLFVFNAYEWLSCILSRCRIFLFLLVSIFLCLFLFSDTLSGLQHAVLIKDEEEVTTTGSIEIGSSVHPPHSPTSQAVAGIAGDLSP
jgi:hypothetical protein